MLGDTHPFIEEWKTVEGFPYYEVSNIGRVRSLDRPYYFQNFAGYGKIHQCVRKGKIRKQFKRKIGYLMVNLTITVKGVQKRKSFSVHRLVAEAFLHNNTNKPCINHIDCNPSNNHVSNLEWVTYKENSEHAVKLGRTNKGVDRYCAKLTEEQVKSIYLLPKYYGSNRDLALKYNVSVGTIEAIVTGKNWKHITKSLK